MCIHRRLLEAGLLCIVAGCGGGGDLLFEDGGVSDAGPDACAPGAGCPCDSPGTKSCNPDDPLVEVICIADADAGPDAGGVAVVASCPPKSACVDGVGCQTCVDTCTEGSLACAEDMKTVLECQPSGPAQCLNMVADLDCTTVKLSTCVPPPSSSMDAGSQDYCVNECGGRNLPLDHKVCDKHDVIPCAFWVCDPTTALLEADHTACLPGGATCNEGPECASCACQNGVCMGSTPKSCALSCQ